MGIQNVNQPRVLNRVVEIREMLNQIATFFGWIETVRLNRGFLQSRGMGQFGVIVITEQIGPNDGRRVRGDRYENADRRFPTREVRSESRRGPKSYHLSQMSRVVR